MQKLLDAIRAAYPQLSFTAGEQFYWSPETHEVSYKSATNDTNDIWALLHETGHALLEHTSYSTDVRLLKMEIEAWEKARALGTEFGVQIDDDHVQDCLDTYRDWLHARALCPGCGTRSLQQDDGQHYRCHNCHTTWKVTPSRFCRPYRSRRPSRPGVVFAEQL